MIPAFSAARNGFSLARVAIPPVLRSRFTHMLPTQMPKWGRTISTLCSQTLSSLPKRHYTEIPPALWDFYAKESYPGPQFSTERVLLGLKGNDDPEFLARILSDIKHFKYQKLVFPLDSLTKKEKWAETLFTDYNNIGMIDLWASSERGCADISIPHVNPTVEGLETIRGQLSSVWTRPKLFAIQSLNLRDPKIRESAVKLLCDLSKDIVWDAYL
ncbi:MAG TPA: hypothetical protein VLE89_07010 [Chlamydiales bacterium]|nr:hypothetical protein [Chlamydiales bacterium]